MTPFNAPMSVLTTFAPSTMTPLPVLMVSVSPLTAFALERHDVGRHDLPGDDVVREDALPLRLVLGLEQRLDRAGGQLRERLVGGANTVKGPAPFSVATRSAA